MSSPNVVQMLERYKPYASHNGMCSAPYDRHTNFERHMGTHNEPSPRYTNINAPSVRRGRCGDIGWNHKLGEHEFFKTKVVQRNTAFVPSGPEPMSVIAERRHNRMEGGHIEECHTRAKHEFLALSGMTWGPSGQGGKQLCSETLRS
eukprot:CAMPEP_0198712774 /NCGR_PEP_ID=MMETSP1471-20131121/4472_1 /TAXON_ID=41880 /ORGANISM="Pycnococcus provasolii, Strain RCC733" /LENGTH=146 /DNA_ID=CAMNT_0044472769 /DNA_START=53 /DNA_END=490 /DNA_ORIENTATION=-